MKAILTLLTLLCFTLVSASAFACDDHKEQASTGEQTTVAQADEGTKKDDASDDDKTEDADGDEKKDEKKKDKKKKEQEPS